MDITTPATYIGYEGLQKLLGGIYSRSTLYSLVSRGQIPHIRLTPRSVAFEPDRIREWMEARRFEPGDKN